MKVKDIKNVNIIRWVSDSNPFVSGIIETRFATEYEREMEVKTLELKDGYVRCTVKVSR